MKRVAIAVSSLVFLCSGICVAQEDDALSVARTFLPPNSAIATLNTYDPAEGRVVGSPPAVFRAHILTGKSNDIVFAYRTGEGDSYHNSMFICLLHRTHSGYVKLFELTYYGKMLWSQDFRTVGLQMVTAPGSSTEMIAVTTAIGASLGGRLEIFKWDSDQGLINLMPGNGGLHHLTFSQDKGGFTVSLGFAKYEGEKGAPEPVVFKWTAGSFAKVR